MINSNPQAVNKTVILNNSKLSALAKVDEVKAEVEDNQNNNSENAHENKS